MDEPRPGQHRVQMPDGLVLKRLPLGYAHGLWRLSFVAHGFDLPVHDRAAWSAFCRDLHHLVRVEGTDGEVEVPGAGSGGDDSEHRLSMDVRADGVTGLRVSYVHDEQVVDTEVLALTD